MKFVKSSLAKKLIIILIALMIFNVVVPKQVQAFDIVSILTKPLCSLIAGVISIFHQMMGNFLNITGRTEQVEIEFSGNSLDDFITYIQTAEAISKVSPEDIFTGKFLILNANIFDYDESSATGGIGNNLIKGIRDTLSNLYIILRNICAIVMLAGLIYTGIRILLSSNIPGKRGEWLKILQDWLIGLILLIFSHIIMIGIFSISDTLTGAIANAIQGDTVGGYISNVSDQIWGWNGSWDSGQLIVYTIIYGYMVWLVAVFVFAYMKRLMWVTVLIILAPVVSVMYAFGRGTQQIYNKWLREYATTVFVQPFHIVVYYVLVQIPLGVVEGDSGFAGLIYSLVAISFIRPAEKFIRQLFGMDKGIVAQASAESGAQTLKATAEGAVKIGTAIATGGATLAGDGKAVVQAFKALGGNKAGAEMPAINPGMGGEADAGIGSPKPQWDSRLTDEQKDEMIAEGIEPGDQEYEQYLGNYGIKGPDPNARVVGDSSDAINIGTSKPNKEPEQSETQKKENVPTDGNTLQIGQAAINIQNAETQIGNNTQTDNGQVRTKDNNESINSAQTDNEKIDNAQINDAQIRTKDNLDEDFQSSKKTGIREVFGAIGNNAADVARTAFDIGMAGFEALNGIADTFEVTGGHSNWKEIPDRYRGYNEEKQKAIKNEFVENKDNIEFVVHEHNLIEKYREMYPNKSEAKIKDYAEQDAKGKLEKMSGYIDKGVQPNVQIINSMYTDQKKYGLSMDEAVKEYAKFAQFNSSSKNVQNLNATFNQNFKTVEQHIPDAKDYYYKNNMTNINDIKQAFAIKEKFGVSRDMACDLQRIISEKAKQGKPIEYKGKNLKEKAMIDELNATFIKEKK